MLPSISLAGHSIRDSLAEAVATACVNDGFFYLTDHGIPTDLVENVFSVAAEYFLQEPSKEKIPREGDLGYTAVRQESLDPGMPSPGDMKESFYLGDSKWMSAHQQNQSLPGKLLASRAMIDSFMDQCASVARKILEALAIALGMPRSFLWNYHSGQHTRLRLLHYPPIQFSNEETTQWDIRAGAHTDYGSITLLFQHRVSGLQVLRNSKWQDVAPLPRSIVVNIGDTLQFWSGGNYKSSLHRVVMPRTRLEAASRFSLAYFVQPDSDTPLEPLRSDTREDIRDKSRSGVSEIIMTFGEYIQSRIQATYVQQRA